MARKFKTVDYEAALELTVTIGVCLPPDHLARFVVEMVKQLDLSCIYDQYGERGGEPYDPRVLLGLLFYGYATGVFSSRQIEERTYSSIPFYFIAGGLHPDHDTINSFRQDFLVELKELFVQILLIAQVAGVLELGNISLDGSKIHADASKSKAVSYKRLLELDRQLQAEVEALFALSQQPDPPQWSDGLDIATEIAFRQNRRVNLSQAKAVLEARAAARYQAELADYEAKLQERAAKTKRTGRKPGGRAPQPPTPGVGDKEQYNFTDPDSPITKNSANNGFDQNYNTQVAVEQQSLLIVANTLPTINRKLCRPWTPSRPCWANPRPGRWTTATLAPTTLPNFKRGAWNLTSPRAVNPITAVGKIILRNKRFHPRMTLRPRRKWPTNYKLTSGRSFMAYANPPSSRSLGLSKKCWASASSPCAVYSRPLVNGTWFALAST